MRTYSSTTKLIFDVVAKCENYNHNYNYQHPITIERGSAQGYSTASAASQALDIAVENVINRYNNVLLRGDYNNWEWSLGKFRLEFLGFFFPFPMIDTQYGLGDTSCPECGYTQSWQVRIRQAKIARGWGWTIAILIAAGIVGVVFVRPDIVGINFSYSESSITNVFGMVFLFLMLLGYIAAIIRAVITPILFPIVLRLSNPNRSFNVTQVINKPVVKRHQS